MSLTWPWMLLGLFAVPFLVRGYRGLLARRARRREQLAAIGLVAPSRVASGARRHVAPALFLAAFVLLVIALARPEASIAQPRREGTVVLAFDVSSSMGATDVKPSRIEAAKTAARAFVGAQPPSIRIGVVAFGATGVVSQRPTADRAAVLDAVDRMAPQGGTSLARGIQTSLSAIADRPLTFDQPSAGGRSLEPDGPDIGFYGSAAVILLSDGESTEGPDAAAAAELASTAGVRIYPVGLGSPRGAVLKIDGFSVQTTLDERSLRSIATTTEGQYFSAAQAGDAAALARIYRSIDLAWVVHGERIEISALFAGAAALLLGLGALLSYAWFGRVV
jgi:Ca-activated chloride channel homolog